MKIKRTVGLCAMLVLLVAVAVSVLAAPAYAANVDYSTQGATGKITLSSSDITDILFGGEITLTAAEREYLDKYGSESVTYAPMVPTSSVESEYDEATGTLTVSASVYKYKSVSGVNMTWTPTRVKFNGEEVALTADGSDAYTATFYGVGEGAEETAEVIYSANVSFTQAALNTLLNKAHDDAEAWIAYVAYTDALAEYNVLLGEYEAYLSERRLYNDKYKEYQQYLKDKAEYDEAKALYDSYVVALERYNSDYAAYVKYLADKEEYLKALSRYEQYLSSCEVAAAQLAVIDGINVGLPTIGRPLYGAIMGTTVSQVLDNKDAIANELTGVDGAVIDLAGEATENLRALFTGYFSLSAEIDKYTYYCLNYETFRDNFNNLLKTLDYLYANAKVRLALSEMDMKEKYEILLAQLYYVVNALNDAPVSNYEGKGSFDSSYRINGKNPISLVEGVPYVKDPTSATPLSTGYPVKVEEPVAPTEVSEPERPAAVSEPLAPAEVPHPGEPPKEVAVPTAPKTVYAPNPALLDAPFVVSDEVRAIISDYEAGYFPSREDVGSARILTLTATATKRVINPDEITVDFYSEAGELLESVTAERGGYVEYTGQTPTKTSVDKLYTFRGWRDADGNPVDMTAVNPEGRVLSLYPDFSEEYKTFEITWQIDGVKETVLYRYGETPSYPSEPQKPAAGAYRYVFSGWDKELTPVDGAKTYTARFDPVPIVRDSNGLGASVEYTDEVLVADCTASLAREFEILHAVEQARSQRLGLTLVLRGGTVSFTYGEVAELSAAGVACISLSSIPREQGGELSYTFFLTLTDGEGERIDMPLRATLTLPYSFSSVEKMKIRYSDGDLTGYARYTPSDGKITLPVISSISYHTVVEYSLGVVAHSEIAITVDKAVASAGERVKISYSAPENMRVTALYYVDSDNTRTDITAGTFVMPADDVTVVVEYEYVTYTVRFASDGRVIHSAEYAPGEIPALPGTPSKVADAYFSYKFVGWDKEISAVTGNTVYNAVYERTAVESKPEKDGLEITPGVLRIIVFVLVALVYAVGVAIPCAVIIAVKLMLRRRALPRKKRK